MSDRDYVIKAKAARMSDKLIAVKMGVSVKRVEEIWREVLAQIGRMQGNGYEEVNRVFMHTLLHYQSMGEHLKELANAFSNVATWEEVVAVVGEDLAQVLMQSFIILRPHHPPEQESEDHAKSKSG